MGRPPKPKGSKALRFTVSCRADQGTLAKKLRKEKRLSEIFQKALDEMALTEAN